MGGKLGILRDQTAQIIPEEPLRRRAGGAHEVARTVAEDGDEPARPDVWGQVVVQRGKVRRVRWARHDARPRQVFSVSEMPSQIWESDTISGFFWMV